MTADILAVPLPFTATCITAPVPACVEPPDTVAPVLVPEEAVGIAIVYVPSDLSASVTAFPLP